MGRTRLFALAVTVVAGMLMVAACGGDDSSSTDAADSVPAVAATAAPVEDTAENSEATEAPAARNPYGDAYGEAPSATTAPTSTAASPSTAARAPAAALPTESPLGTILTDAAGLTVYGFTQDATGTPTCTGGCADNWPPVTVDGGALPDGLDPAVFSVVERADGTFQLKAGDWPLYRFAGDAAPGDTNGQAAGGVWFVVAPDGTLIQ
jgi:predicted lipoprotein with Yx(FWY)xxD motif